MSQYTSPGFGQYPSQSYVEQRTSVLAVLSLVFALICCLPGPAVLGTIFGVAGLIAISRSNDRLVGRGLAIAGIIVSLVVTAVWMGATIGMGRVWTQYKIDFAEPIAAKVKAMDQGDYSALRASLTPEANARITEADFNTLVQGYQAELGSVVGTPAGAVQTIKSFMTMGPALEQMQGRNDVVPTVVMFDKGPGLVMLQLDPSATPGNRPTTLKYVNIVIATPQGKKWTLWDPVRLPPGGGPAGSTTAPSGSGTPDTTAPEAPAAPETNPKEPG